MKWRAGVVALALALALPAVTAAASGLPDEWRQRNNASLQADGADEYEMAVVQYFLDRSLDACMKAHVAAAPKTTTPAQLRPPRVTVYLAIDAKGAVSDVATSQDDAFAQCLAKQARTLTFASPPKDPFVAMVSVAVQLTRGGQR